MEESKAKKTGGKREGQKYKSLVEKLIDIMEDDNDVQNMWHNWEE